MGSPGRNIVDLQSDVRPLGIGSAAEGESGLEGHMPPRSSAANRTRPVAATTVVSPVLLVLAGGTVSQAVISRTAELAAGEPVTVIGTSAGQPGAAAGP